MGTHLVGRTIRFLFLLLFPVLDQTFLLILLGAMTSTKTIDCLSVSELSVLLNVFHLDVPGQLTAQERRGILKYHSGYTAPFGKYSFEQVQATFSNESKNGKLTLKFVSLQSVDGKVCVRAPECDSPCTVCHKDVHNGTGPLGDGLVCSGCSQYFHNSCTSSPLDRTKLKALNNSPSYVQLICPVCMPKVNSKSSDQSSKSYGNISQLLSEVKCIKAYVTDIYSMLEKHCNFVSTDKQGISCQLATLNTELECTKSKVDLLDITGACDAVPVLCDELSGKLDDVKRSVDTTLSSMEQSVDHAVNKVSQLDQFPLGELMSKVDSAMVNMNKNTPQSHADVMKEIKLAHKKLELHCADIKKDTTEIKEKCNVSDAGVNQSKRANLVHLQDTSNKILDEVSRLPLGIKANSNWDRIEAASSFSSVTGSNAGAQQRRRSQITAAQNELTVPHAKQHSRCDETKTIAIDNIVSFDMFVKKSYDTKKEFNKHFPRIKIVQCKRTRHGSLLIELEDIKTAKEVVEKWQPSFFSVDAGVQNMTTATLLQNKNIKGVICDVNIAMTDSAILEEIRDQFGWSNIKLRRFVDRQGIVRPTVLVHFSSSEELEEAKRKGVFLDNVYCEIRVFEPKASVTQCFNCYGFDHTVVWCPKKQKVCPHCSQSHKPTECLIKQENDTEQFKCPNCRENRQHSATDDSCPVFKEKLSFIQHRKDHGQ